MKRPGEIKLRKRTPAERRAYQAGYAAALRTFAWWKDGVEYVGCGIKTLQQALDEAELAEQANENADKHVDVPWCARCGNEHKRLAIVPFSVTQIGDSQYWATCPDTGDPILIEVTIEVTGETARQPPPC